MDFTMNMIENHRAVPSSQATSVSALGPNVTVYQTHQAPHGVSIQQTQHQPQHNQHQVPNHAAMIAAASAAALSVVQQTHGRTVIHDENGHPMVTNASKLQELTKDDSEETFTPPPRVSSVSSISHMENRIEKGTDTNDFEPVIKIEIRGGIHGLNLGPERIDKNSVVQLHFNTPAEVIHYFTQRSVPQLDAFNLLTNSDIVRNINPELVRNHFLYVPNNQEGAVRVPANGFVTTNGPPQAAVQTGPVIVAGPNGIPKTIKQEKRRGDVPPGTIIHRNIQLEALPNQFVCWICGVDLQKSLPFEEHMVDQHSVEKPYKCNDCGVMFKRKAHLDRHRRIHLPVRPYQCGVCGKGFTRNEHVRRHAFTHSGEKPYTCPSCGKTFSRREHLAKHLPSHAKPMSPSQLGHPQTPGEYEEYIYSPAESPNLIHHTQHIAQMQQQAQTQQMIFQSQENVHGSTVPLHISQLSSSQTSQSNTGINMTKHRQNIPQGLTTTLLLQTTDQNGRIVTINPAGNAVPSSAQSLVTSITQSPNHSYHASVPPGTIVSAQPASSQQHSGRQQNGEPSRPYQCGVCGKAFIRNEHLRRHVLTHSGEKPHSCSLCGKKFSRREHLTKHLRSHATKVTTVTGTAVQQIAPTTSVTLHPASTIQPGPSTPAPPPLPQASMQTSTQNTISLPIQSSSSNGPTPAPAHSQTVTHSMSSHSNPVAHLPPGTHYLNLPMFGLLAEVV